LNSSNNLFIVLFFKLNNRHCQSQDHSIHYKWSIITMHLSFTVMEIWRLKDNGVASLTFWGHVTLWVTWPFDSQERSSYGWSIDHVSVWHSYEDMAPQR